MQDLQKQAAKSEAAAAAAAAERPSAEQRLKVASTMSATINQVDYVFNGLSSFFYPEYFIEIDILT